jgi:hypothetical protein
MSNTYRWVITQLTCVPQQYGKTDVVINVSWQQIGNNGSYNASVHGASFVTYTPGSPFTPYSDLTQDQVIEWVQASLGPEQCAALTASLDQQLGQQTNSPVVNPPLPWG